MRKSWECPCCGKCFMSERGTRDHIRDAHHTDSAPRRRPKPPKPDRELSIADQMIDAQLRQAMGEQLDETELWLVDFD